MSVVMTLVVHFIQNVKWTFAKLSRWLLLKSQPEVNKKATCLL